MIRLFVALKIPEDIKSEIILLRNSLVPAHEKYKWETEDKLHLTLKFIGNVKDEFLPAMLSSLEFVKEFNKFSCELSRFGFFYNKGKAKILWLGLSVDNSIYLLVNKLNNEMEKFSIPQEKRKFKAHLTLLRLKGDTKKSFINTFENAEVPKIKFIADQIVLVKSDLLSGGSKYTEIKNYNLK